MKWTVFPLAAWLVVLSACGGAATPASTAPASSAGVSAPASSVAGSAAAGKPAASPGSGGASGSVAASAPASAGASGSVSASQSGGVLPSLAPSVQARLEQLYQAAKKEGQLVWSVSAVADTVRPVVAVFNRRFPDIKVSIVDLQATLVPQRILTETAANRLTIDVVTANPVQLLPLGDRGLVLSHDFNGMGLPADRIGFDNRILYTTDIVVAWFNNKNLVTAADMPTKPEDLLNPKWKGKIVTDPGGASFTTFTPFWDDAKIEAFVKQLNDGGYLIPVTGNDQIARIGRGEAAFGVVPVQRATDTIDQGAPADVMTVFPALKVQNGPLTIKGLPHPNAAELFYMWLSTPEAQDALDKANSGLITPCGPTPSDKLICNKNLTYNTQDTPEKVKHQADLSDTLAKIIAQK